MPAIMKMNLHLPCRECNYCLNASSMLFNVGTAVTPFISRMTTTMRMETVTRCRNLMMNVPKRFFALQALRKEAMPDGEGQGEKISFDAVNFNKS